MSPTASITELVELLLHVPGLQASDSGGAELSVAGTIGSVAGHTSRECDLSGATALCGALTLAPSEAEKGQREHH